MRLTHLLLALLVSTLIAHASSLVGSVNTSIDTLALRVLYDKSLDKAVAIIVYGRQYGTAWLLAPHHDILVTAAHVVGFNDAKVVVIHGKFRSIGRVIALDRKLDIAVIRLEEPWEQGKPLPLCTRPPEKGSTILVIGYPFELIRVSGSLEKASANPRAAFGIVAWRDGHIFEFTATTDQGNSGGPVVDADAICVYGIVSFALRGSVGVTYYASDVEAIKSLLEKSGIKYVEKDVTNGMLDISVDTSSRVKTYAVIGAAAIGGLLLGLLLNGSRRRVYALIPLVAAAAALANVAHAETVTLLAGEGILVLHEWTHIAPLGECTIVDVDTLAVLHTDAHTSLHLGPGVYLYTCGTLTLLAEQKPVCKHWRNEVGYSNGTLMLKLPMGHYKIYAYIRSRHNPPCSNNRPLALRAYNSTEPEDYSPGFYVILPNGASVTLYLTTRYVDIGCGWQDNIRIYGSYYGEYLYGPVEAVLCAYPVPPRIVTKTETVTETLITSVTSVSVVTTTTARVERHVVMLPIVTEETETRVVTVAKTSREAAIVPVAYTTTVLVGQEGRSTGLMPIALAALMLAVAAAALLTRR